MPGTDLNIDLPVAGDNFGVYRAKILAAVQAIIADIEPRIGSGALDIDTELSMNGAPLTNVGGVRLQNGFSTVIGTLYMDEELHAVTSAGDVQITAGGVLNVTALGTIGGDYGGANPAEVTFNDLANEYRFKEDSSSWSTLSAKGMLLNDALGNSFRLSCDPGLSGDQQIKFKSVPTTGHGMFAYNSADSSLVDAVGVSPMVGGMTFTANIDVAGHKILHTDQSANGHFTTAGAVSIAPGAVAGLANVPGVSVGAGAVYFPLHFHLPSTARIKSFTVYFVDTSYSNLQWGVVESSTGGFSAITGLTALTGISGLLTSTLTATGSVYQTSGKPWWIWFDMSLGVNCKPLAWRAVFDVVA